MLVDFVPNHTSDQHPWFEASRSSKDDPKRDWYVWRDPAADGGPPNNWVAAFSPVPAWTFDEATGQYYLHQFLAEQPDLNWANPEVEAAMHDVLRFWLDRGVDGFRVDVVHGIGKDPDLADDPAELAGLPHVPLNDRPETHVHIRRLRELLDGYPGERMMLGEVYLLDTHLVAAVLRRPTTSCTCRSTSRRSTPGGRRRRGATRSRPPPPLLDPIDAWPTWVLSNHDNPRHRTRYGVRGAGPGGRRCCCSACAAPRSSTPARSSGLRDAEIPPERVVDPGGRDGCRAPIPWDPTPATAGRSEPVAAVPARGRLPQRRRRVGRPPLDPHPLPAVPGRPAGLGGPARRRPAPRCGCPDGVLGWVRSAGADRRVVLVNFTGEPVDLDGTEALGATAGLGRRGGERPRRRGLALHRPPRPRPGRLAPPHLSRTAP